MLVLREAYKILFWLVIMSYVSARRELSKMDWRNLDVVESRGGYDTLVCLAQMDAWPSFY
jgi:hypothetical protein